MRLLTQIAFSSVSLMALSMPAFAQDAADDGISSGDEIVVQARRRDESLQDVPLTVQAVTGQDLQRLEIRRFEDVSKLVPGLSLDKAVGAGASASLRGLNFDSRANGSATSVEFYRDDAVASGAALLQAVYDIGQIEVLRGPQGTLRGRASPSGSITVTTRKPDLTEAGGYVSGTVSNRHRWNFNGAVNVPIIGDKLAVRVAGFLGGNRGNGIFGLNVPLNTIDRDIYDKSEALRASVRADPFDGVLVLDFNYETIHAYSRQYRQSQSASDFEGGAASPRTITANDRLGVGSEAHTLDQTYKFYNWQAKFRQWGQSLTYVGSRMTGSAEAWDPSDDAGLYPTLLVPSSPPAGSPSNRLGQYQLSLNTQTTHELRLQNEDRVAGLFDYVIGGFKVNGTTPTLLMTASPTSATISGATPNYTLNGLTYRATGRPRVFSESSLFGNLTLHLGERTEVSGGLRHIWYKSDAGTISNISFLDPFNTGVYIQRACAGGEGALPDVPSLNPTVCQPRKEATIYAASIKHKFTDDLMAYFSFGTSWRPGNTLVGWGLQNPGTPLTYGAFINQFMNLPDETSKSFEVGLKTAWFDRRLKFNISGFYQKFNNYPLYGSTAVSSLNQPNQTGAVLLRPFSFASPVNVTIKGIEADMSFDISPRFSIAANFAFADSSAKGAIVPCVDTNNDNLQDSVALNPVGDPARYGEWLSQIGTNQVDTCRIDASPTSQARFSGTFLAEYRQPVSDWGEAYLRGFVSWKGDSAGDPVNTKDQVNAYALVDLFAGIRDQRGAWEVGAFVKNLFDTKRVLTRGSGVTTSAIDGLGQSRTYNYYSISTIEPREVGVSLRYSFGSR